MTARYAARVALTRRDRNFINPSDGVGYPAEPGTAQAPMIGLLQRVTHAEVRVADRRVGAIEKGLLVLVGVERGDGEAQADRLLERLCSYRVFEDADGRMNRSLQDIGGQLLLVSQFTLAADTRSGTRPGFSPAAPPEEGRRLFDYLVERARARLGAVQTGEFGANMQVSLTNDGPVTFRLQVPPSPQRGEAAQDQSVGSGQPAGSG